MIIGNTKFDSTVTLFSDTNPAVRYTLNVVTHGRRTRLRLALAKSLHKIREIAEQVNVLVEEGNFTTPKQVTEGITALPDDAVEDTKAKIGEYSTEQKKIIAQIEELNDDINLITASEVDLEYLRAGFVSLEGVLIDGLPATADSLYEFGDEQLCLEILSAVKRQFGVSNEVKASLESPTTSGAAVGGQTSDMTAPNVSVITGTSTEIAPDTSQSE